MKNKTATHIMVTAVRIALPVLLAIGAFLGFPHDQQLSGFYWLFVALQVLLELSGVDER